MGSRRLTVLLVLVCAAVALAAPAAQAAPSADVSGTWSVYSGGCGCWFDETYAMDPSGSVTGTGPEVGWTITGNVSGSTFTYTDHYAGSYESHVTVTLAGDGNAYEGSFEDIHHVTGEIKGKRISGGGSKEPEKGNTPEKEKAPETPAGAHGTAMTVSCNLDALTLQDTCTAVVADTVGLNPTAPTGTVTFAAASGFFPFGKECVLHSSATAPSTGFCSVEYAPGAGAGFPNVGAGYPGDATHAATTGSTRFILPGGEPAGYEESGPGSGYPTELTVEVQTPAPKTEVQAGVNQGETKAPAPPGKHLRAIEDPDIIPSMREEVAEREREQRYPDIIPSMRKEVEEREIRYEKDLRELRTEINEMERNRAGLNAQATDELTRLMQVDNLLAKQMAEQLASPGLKKDAASQPTLEKLTKQSTELQKQMQEVLKIQHQQIEGVTRAVGSAASYSLVRAVSPVIASSAGAKKAHPGGKVTPRGRLVVLGHAHRVADAAGTVKLRLHLNKAQLKRLAHGRKTIKLNLRILMVVPSHYVKSGLPLGMLRTITLHAGKHAAAHKH
ncbi:MAG TPA: hypothetical protein VMF55_09175 [Solirubrobacterales bacterium]|nr:hypothetical protein [Solirubrobacterales bacterium]